MPTIKADEYRFNAVLLVCDFETRASQKVCFSHSMAKHERAIRIPLLYHRDTNLRRYDGINISSHHHTNGK
jgi:hypothetical protein